MDEAIVSHVTLTLRNIETLQLLFARARTAGELVHLKVDTGNDIQCQRFDLALRALEIYGLRPRWGHLANSAGAFFSAAQPI